MSIQSKDIKTKKLAVIFPGIGYTCKRPLLYYTAQYAAERGYEVIRLDYGEEIHNVKDRDMSRLQPLVKEGTPRVLKQLEVVVFPEYQDIVFISKSVGTVIACEIEKQLRKTGCEKQIRHFMMTPVPLTFSYLEEAAGIFMAGTGDPYTPKKLILEMAEKYPVKAAAIFENCNHSLEQEGDTFGNLKNLEKVLKLEEKFLFS